MDSVCVRCAAPISTDSKGQWANTNTLSYRCLTVGEKHIPAAAPACPECGLPVKSDGEFCGECMEQPGR